MDKSTEFDYRTIKAFEDACSRLGLDPEKLPVVEGLPEEEAQATIDQYKLWICARAVRGDWKPDWANSNQKRYYPWFYMGGASGLGFSLSDVGRDSATSRVGSRLCFPSEEMAEYFGKTFLELYRSVFGHNPPKP